MRCESGRPPHAWRRSWYRSDCNETIDQAVSEIPTDGLNVALIDPFNLAALSFATIGKLATFTRMDLIVFFPIGEIRRNLERNLVFASKHPRGDAIWESVTSKTPRGQRRLF